MQVQSDINALAIRAKNSDEDFSTLVTECRVFMLKCAGQSLHRYVSENDDAWSVALQAFYEAVRAYEPEKGKFLTFASLVISNRMKDLLASEYRRKPEVMVGGDILEGVSEDESVQTLQAEVQENIAKAPARDMPGTTPIQDEIEAVGQILKKYGFSFFDLADASPKAEKTRKKCAAVIRMILQDPEFIAQIRLKNQLPMKELSKKCKVPLKTMENHRRYIIAAVEILNGDFPLLAEYLRSVREES